MEFVREAMRIERRNDWESKYFWLGLALVVVESFGGLYLLFIDDLTHLDMTLLLFHILAGFPFVFPCMMFWRRHRRYAPIVERPGFTWLGWSCVLSMAFALISGIWLTFRGISGIYWLWLSHTVVSLYGFAALGFNLSFDGDPQHLPTAHTCSHNLVLPLVRTRQELKEKLDVVIQEGVGFGFA